MRIWYLLGNHITMLRDKIKEELRLLSEQQLDYDRSGGEDTRDWWRAKLQSYIMSAIEDVDQMMYDGSRSMGHYNEMGVYVPLAELKRFSNAEIAGILDKVMRRFPPAYGNPSEY